jgi:hypothetical protein
LIYAPRFTDSRLTPVGRLVALGIATGCLTLLLLAASLTPNASGMGTHTGLTFLKLRPCNFLYTSGIPCPSCGMTTSFSYFVRGNVLASFYLQPMGFVLAALCAVGFWVGGYEAVTGRPAHRIFRQIPYNYWLIPLLGFALLAWAWKIWIHVRGWDGWGP